MNEFRAGGNRRQFEDLEAQRDRSETQARGHFFFSSTGVLLATGSMDEDSRLGPASPTPPEEP